MVKAGGKKKRKGEMPTFEKKAAGPNLFERLSNKKRFDVLGKKVKGETRHTGRLRTAAVEKVRGAMEQARGCMCVPVLAARQRAATAPVLRRVCLLACSARARCWWSTSSCASPTPSSTAALGVSRPAALPARPPAFRFGLLRPSWARKAAWMLEYAALSLRHENPRRGRRQPDRGRKGHPPLPEAAPKGAGRRQVCAA